MSLTVCTSSTGFDGCLIKPVKALLGITGASDDELLVRLGERAVDAIEGYLGYPIRLQVYSESLPAYGGRHLMVSRTPIRTVLRLFDSTSTDTATEFASTEYRVEDADAGLLSRDAGFAWTAPLANEYVDFYQAGQETRPYYCEYGAGWRLTGATSTDAGVTTTGPDAPGDVLQALDETIKGWYVGRQQDAAVQSVTVGSLSMTFRSAESAQGGGTLPVTATALLARRRRLA